MPISSIGLFRTPFNISNSSHLHPKWNWRMNIACFLSGNVSTICVYNRLVIAIRQPPTPSLDFCLCKLVPTYVYCSSRSFRFLLTWLIDNALFFFSFTFIFFFLTVIVWVYAVCWMYADRLGKHNNYRENGNRKMYGRSTVASCRNNVIAIRSISHLEAKNYQRHPNCVWFERNWEKFNKGSALLCDVIGFACVVEQNRREKKLKCISQRQGKQ